MAEGSATLLAELRERIACERTRPMMPTNAAMVMLYWEIGQSILVRQEEKCWRGSLPTMEAIETEPGRNVPDEE